MPTLRMQAVPQHKQVCSQSYEARLLRPQASFPTDRFLPVSPIFFRQVKQRFFFCFGFSEAVLPSALFWDISSRVPEKEARVLLPFLINQATQSFHYRSCLRPYRFWVCARHLHVHVALADIPQTARFPLFHRDLHLTQPHVFSLFQIP